MECQDIQSVVNQMTSTFLFIGNEAYFEKLRFYNMKKGMQMHIFSCVGICANSLPQNLRKKEKTPAMWFN